MAINSISSLVPVQKFRIPLGSDGGINPQREDKPFPIGCEERPTYYDFRTGKKEYSSELPKRHIFTVA